MTATAFAVLVLTATPLAAAAPGGAAAATTPCAVGADSALAATPCLAPAAGGETAATTPQAAGGDSALAATARVARAPAGATALATPHRVGADPALAAAPRLVSAPASAAPPPVRAPVRDALRAASEVDVLVLVSSAPHAVIAALPASEVRHARVLRGLDAFAATVTAAGADALARHPAVVGVQLERRLRALTAESAAVVGADVVRDGLGVTGRGVVVAALDTGVDATHPDLQDGGVVAQKCFVLGGCPPGNTDEGDWAPEGSGHGTHVTGIVTGDGRVAPKGLAPGAGVVMVRVFDDTSYGRESDWALAMGWVADHAGALGIRVLNLSIGTDERYAGACEADWPVMAEAARRVRDAGVVLIAAAGNENEANALVAPACLPGVLSVGAVYDAALGREPDTGTYSSGCVDAATDAGTVMCLSNTSDELDLLAPGSRTRNAAPGGGVAERRGTSQATPHASAVAALMLEVDPALTPDDVERLLEETGRPTVDPKAPGRVTPLVDARAAVEATRASYCARHADGTRCALTFGACDGGACEGVCLDGRCRDSAVKTVGAVEGVWPRAPVGCASVDGAGLLALAAWRCRRRGGQRARLRA